MNYFQPYPLGADETIVAAWDSQVADAAETPWLAEALATRTADLFPRFAACYAQLRALPRGARRALQRQLARSRQLVMLSPEWQRKLATSLAGAALLLALSQGAQAATIKVTTTRPEINDGDHRCSLSEAIVNANHDSAIFHDCPAGSGADTIILPKHRTLTLSKRGYYSYADNYTGLPFITSKITIEGNGAMIARQPRRGDHGYFYDLPEFRLLTVTSSGDLTLRNTTLSGGHLSYFHRGLSGSGGAILNSGMLRIENTKISGNYAGNRGGGIKNYGTLILEHSTISGNTAGYSGGGISNVGTVSIERGIISDNTVIDGDGGGIYNGSYSTATIENSTISGNTAGERGGGMYNYAAYVTVKHSTISGNSAEYGGGIFNVSFLTGTLAVNRSLVSGNNAAYTPNEIVSFFSTEHYFNLFGLNGSAGVNFLPGPSDIVPGAGITLNKILEPLKNNGGPTKTYALPKGSPAIDAASADSECPATDQRGVARPRGAGCDIGAFER